MWCDGTQRACPSAVCCVDSAAGGSATPVDWTADGWSAVAVVARCPLTGGGSEAEREGGEGDMRLWLDDC